MNNCVKLQSDPAISNSVNSKSPLFRRLDRIPLDLPFPFTLPRLFRNPAISIFFPFPLRLRNSGVRLYVGRKGYWYTFTKHRDRFYILFFWEILKGSATDYNQWSLTLTTYPLSSQLHPICLRLSLCWVYSLQLQALLAPGLLSTKDRFLC